VHSRWALASTDEDDQSPCDVVTEPRYPLPAPRPSPSSRQVGSDADVAPIMVIYCRIRRSGTLLRSGSSPSPSQNYTLFVRRSPLSRRRLKMRVECVRWMRVRSARATFKDVPLRPSDGHVDTANLIDRCVRHTTAVLSMNGAERSSLS